VWTPKPPGYVVLILLSQPLPHTYQCQLYISISLRVRIAGTTTISGMPKDLAVVAAACPTVEWVPAQACPSQSQGSSRSHGN
jgi:hypothetical protein